MGESKMPFWFILYSIVLYQYKSPGGLAKLQAPGGLANFSITRDFLWFIIPLMIAKCISLAVKIAQRIVGPTTWKKMEEYAKNAMFVAAICEVIAIHNLGILFVSDYDDWGRSLFTWLLYGVEGSLAAFLLFSWVYYGRK